MNVQELKAITYITEVAVAELTILDWLNILNSLYKDGIPENAKFCEAINTYIEQFEDFQELAKDDTQKGLDNLYEKFMEFVKTKIDSEQK